MPDWPVVGNLLNTVLSAAAGRFMSRWLERRPKLLAYFVHTSAFRVRTHDLTIHTHSIVVWNTGQKAATNVRVLHPYLPEHVNVYPAETAHEVRRTTEHGGEIFFPALVPKEQVTISYLYFPPVVYSQIHAGIKHDGGFARAITVVPARYPAWVNTGLLSLVAVGALTVLYLLVEAARWLATGRGWW